MDNKETHTRAQTYLRVLMVHRQSSKKRSPQHMLSPRGACHGRSLECARILLWCHSDLQWDMLCREFLAVTPVSSHNWASRKNTCRLKRRHASNAAKKGTSAQVEKRALRTSSSKKQVKCKLWQELLGMSPLPAPLTGHLASSLPKLLFRAHVGAARDASDLDLFEQLPRPWWRKRKRSQLTPMLSLFALLLRVSCIVGSCNLSSTFHGMRVGDRTTGLPRKTRSTNGAANKVAVLSATIVGSLSLCKTA